MLKNYLPELLAPAGSMESLMAAVNAGADAVYISGKRFGARHYASNFEDKEIEDAINYAHLQGVKVYVTVNTLIKDSELPDVVKYLFWLYKTGVDAVIVQDLGVAGLCRSVVPDLDMHASTQMTIHNLEDVKWAAKFGFKRVILAREVGVGDIKRISKKMKEESKRDKSWNMELEVFGHGALCYSYSGQCLMSSFIGGRSGNRGMCAQPCRKPYKLVTGRKDEFGRPLHIESAPLKERYLISTHDLSVYRHLDEIVASGANSIKLEGRMRSPEYVAVVVETYRKALDAIKKGTWKPSRDEISKLKFAFNRGFTDGYILNASYKSVMGRNAPGNMGLYVGDVLSLESHGKTVVKLKNPIIPGKGDGIVFRSLNPEDPNHGMFVEETPLKQKNRIILKVQKPVKVGYKLFITRKKSLMDSAEALIKKAPISLTPITISLKWDEKMVPIAECEFPTPKDNGYVCFHYKAPFSFEPAVKHPLNPEQIKKQLAKTGGTPFFVKDVEMKYPGDLFVPISKLNQMRRDMLEKAHELLLKSCKPHFHDVESAENRLRDFLRELEPASNPKFRSMKATKQGKPVLGAYVDRLEVLEAACRGGCTRVYFEPITPGHLNLSIKRNIENYFKDIFNALKKAGSICSSMNVDLIWKLPSITPQLYLDHAASLVRKLSVLNVSGVMVDGIGSAEAVKSADSSIEIYGAAGLNVWNHQTVHQLSNLTETDKTFDGRDKTSTNSVSTTFFKSLTVSPELSKGEVRSLILNSRLKNVKTSLELLVQGNVEVMVTEDSLPALKTPRTTPYEEFTGIEDVKKRIFPVNTNYDGRTRILNSVELCLVDYLPSIIDMGINSIVIDSRSKTPAYAFEVASVYSDAVEKSCSSAKGLKKILKTHKNRIKKVSTGGITTGNFLRGVDGR